MRDVPLAVPMGMSLADIARRMEAEQASSATVLNAEGRPAGIVTEQDITRTRLLKMAIRFYTASHNRTLPTLVMWAGTETAVYKRVIIPPKTFMLPHVILVLFICCFLRSTGTESLESELRS